MRSLSFFGGAVSARINKRIPVRKLAFSFSLCLSFFPPLSVAGDSIDSAIPSTEYAKPQRLVPVDGQRRLNLFCIGTGTPTVIFDAGTGGGTRDWRAVQREIAKYTTACSYDRAGYGFSDAPTRASDASNAVDDLHSLVINAGLKKPLVLVGHSNGGIYSVLYARKYPKDVGGMVLVDPGFTGQQNFERYKLSPHKVDELKKGNADLVAFAQHCLELAKSGALARPSNQASLCLDNPHNPDPLIHRMLMHLEVKPGFFEAYLSEFQSTFVMKDGATVNDREVPLSDGMFGSMPLIVLTASQHRASWPDFTPEDQKKYFDYWKRSHDKLATLSKNGQSLLVENSGHFIQKDQPAVVIKYVEQVVKQVRKNAG